MVRFSVMGVGGDFKPRISQPMLSGMAIALNLPAAVVFGIFVGPRRALRAAPRLATAIGLIWVTPFMLIAYLFARRSLTLAMIHASYVVVQFIFLAAIFFWLTELPNDVFLDTSPVWRR
jgi:hypothetical protein